ncbi:hypothetical protein TIFTF001_033090 [Ficus carica]|uniref:Protein kinase domain-containing protein n=1 Tax=Ficus carica TaxID=3494 RepID=A0AA88J794_FICCA|nr:hypothetical protein TIFTF001_033090 [Ficus carica]
MASSMKNLQLIILALLIYSFSSNHYVIITTIFAYVPKENIALDCGSPDDQTTEDGRIWIRDHDKDSRYSLIEVEGQSKSNIFIASSQYDSVDRVPYMTARVSRFQFTYSFRVTPGPKFIRLHFYSTRYHDQDDFDPSKAFFTVKAGPFTLLSNFSAFLTAEFLDQRAFMREFCLNVEENIEKLDIVFLPSSSPLSENHVNSSYVFVNGIEIVSMPTTLYYTPPTGKLTPPLLGNLGRSFGDYSNRALQMVHRLNVGGSGISPMNDTGMYRQWTSDFKYFISEGFVSCNTSRKPKYSTIPNYTAPDDVYRTAITMGNNATKNTLRNVTWRLPVDSRFFYLVRLHFCEFDESLTKAGDRIFRIYIDNYTADNAFSVMDWSGGNMIPVYRDFVVSIVDEPYLFVDLHTREMDSTYADAILNGLEVFKISNYDRNLAGPNPSLLASPGSDQTLNPTTNKSKSNKTLPAIALGSGVAGFLVLLSMVCCVVLLRLRKTKRRPSSYKRKSSKSTRGSSRRLPEQLCQRFSFSEIKSATNNFEQALEIGRGGFGNVYRGHIDDEFPEVAIKRLSKGSSRQGEREFEAEIKMLSQLRHVHLVSLIGYCDEGSEMILVYDYMANGTLRDHLYGTNNDPLSWKQRLEICVGAARGLHYLHSEVKDTIIHRDVKTTNILLDDKWVAKVADFGLSREGRGDSGAVSTVVRGTFGYLDPEYAQSRQLTDKSDVYSFGVVLFEVLCARKPVDVKLEEEQRNLAQWARRCVREGKIQDIIDPFLMGKISPECFKNFVQVAEKCVRDHRNRRPTMRDVAEKLEFALELQEKADAAKQAISPDGVYVYPDLSFHLVDDHHDHGHGYDVLGLHGGTYFSTTVGSDSVESSLRSVDTESGKIRDVFSDASNSKSRV